MVLKGYLKENISTFSYWIKEKKLKMNLVCGHTELQRQTFDEKRSLCGIRFTLVLILSRLLCILLKMNTGIHIHLIL